MNGRAVLSAWAAPVRSASAVLQLWARLAKVATCSTGDGPSAGTGRDGEGGRRSITRLMRTPGGVKADGPFDYVIPDALPSGEG